MPLLPPVTTAYLAAMIRNPARPVLKALVVCARNSGHVRERLITVGDSSVSLQLLDGYYAVYGLERPCQLQSSAAIE
jgi:hypothetical protein